MRESLTSILKANNYRVQEFASATEFLELHKACDPAVMLLDMQLPDMSGIELQNKVRTINPTLPIVFISGQCKNSQIVEGLKTGAVDFLFKPFGVGQLLEAVTDALRRHTQAIFKLEIRSDTLSKYQSLTLREREISHLLALGMSNLSIADRLGISPATVKIHKSRVLEKLDVDSEIEISRMYVAANLDSE